MVAGWGHQLGAYHGSLGTFGTSWALQNKTRSVSDRGWHGGVGGQQLPHKHREGNWEPRSKDKRGGARSKAWRGRDAGPAARGGHSQEVRGGQRGQWVQ